MTAAEPPTFRLASEEEASREPRIFEPEYYRQLYQVEERHGWSAGMRGAMRALLGPRLTSGSGLRVLDAGCGTGYLLEELRRTGICREPVGIDISPSALSFCQRRGARALAQATAVRLPFRPGSFDLVLCIDTLQHLSPTGAALEALREAVRVLRPGGWLYLRTNSALGHRPAWGADSSLYRRYTVREVRELLKAAGLEVERATYLNALPGLWAAIREHTRPPVTHPRSGPALSIRPPAAGSGWRHAALRAILGFEAFAIGRLGIDLPFGHSCAFVARRPAGAAEPAPTRRPFTRKMR
jgi:SAM-dependent methyltransferase